MFGAARTLFRREEIQKSNSGGGKDLEEFELYLPLHWPPNMSFFASIPDSSSAKEAPHDKRHKKNVSVISHYLK